MNSNRIAILTYGYMADPSLDNDSSHDYFIFLIWGAVTPNGDQGWSLDTAGWNDANGPAMDIGVNVSTTNSLVLIDTVRPNSADFSNTTQTKTFGISYDGFGVNWGQTVPIWQIHIPKLNNTYVEWMAGINNWPSTATTAFTWGYGFALAVPEGQKSVSLNVFGFGSFWKTVNVVHLYTDHASSGRTNWTFRSPYGPVPVSSVVVLFLGLFSITTARIRRKRLAI